ncbi:MAG: hypothetical protein M0Z43_13630 [Acidithiobacillus sp.]|nr:hypothetical protein [Acidithiobacillus sp.]
MIKIKTVFKSIGPLHTGSDTNAGTLKSLRRQACVLAQPVQYESRLSDQQRRDAVVHICLGVWYSIDWENMRKSRMMGIWDEFSNKLIAAGRASNKYQFLENLCRSWGIQSVRNAPNVLKAIDALTDYELLDIVRHETQYICLMLRAIKDEAKERKKEDGFTSFDLPPIIPMETPVQVVRVRGDIPAISGNSIRGKMRRLAMHDFCQRVGIQQMDKRTYHTLFTGGFLDQSTKYEDFDKLEFMVSHCPMLGVLGAAIGNMTIEGELKVGWAYPLCCERGTSAQSYWEYIDTVFQTRSDSSKTEKAIALSGGDHTQQMKYEYECFSSGTPFEWRLACTATKPLIVSAFWHLLALFQAEPYIGGMGAVGNGEISMDLLREIPEGGSDEYLAHLEKNAGAMQEYWQEVKI